MSTAASPTLEYGYLLKKEANSRLIKHNMLVVHSKNGTLVRQVKSSPRQQSNPHQRSSRRKLPHQNLHPRRNPQVPAKAAQPKRHRLLGLTAFLAFVMGFTYSQWSSDRSPQAVLVLGGSLSREKFATEFAQQHPDLPIWVSGGSNPEYAEWLFAKAGIERDRVHLDYDAVDTVTNFTTMVDKLKARDIQSIYLITSDYHMRRARVIGEIVLGSRGIDLQPVPVKSERPPEPLEKAVLDGARAVLWLTTGSTGSTLGQALRSQPLSPSSASTAFKESLGRFLPELRHKAERSGP